MNNTSFLYKNWHFFIGSLFGFLCLCVNLVTLHLNFIVMAVFCQLNIVITFVCVIFAKILLLQLYQLHKFIKLAVRAPRVLRLKQFFAFHSRILKDIREFNQLYGTPLVVYLLANCPVNAYLVISIWAGHYPGFEVLKILPIIIQQYLCIFFLHIMGARFAKQISTPCKQIIYIYNFKTRITWSSRFLLKIANYIAAIHTRNPYRLTYGKYGDITWSGMFKV